MKRLDAVIAALFSASVAFSSLADSNVIVDKKGGDGETSIELTLQRNGDKVTEAIVQTDLITAAPETPLRVRINGAAKAYSSIWLADLGKVRIAIDSSDNLYLDSNLDGVITISERVTERTSMASAWEKGYAWFIAPLYVPAGVFHTIAPKETLSGVAQRYYGVKDEKAADTLAQALFEINKERGLLRNSISRDMVYPNQKVFAQDLLAGLSRAGLEYAIETPTTERTVYVALGMPEIVDERGCCLASAVWSHMSGTIRLGGMEYSIAVLSGNRTARLGDVISIDINNDGIFEVEGDSPEFYRPNAPFNVNGEVREMRIADYGSKLTLLPSKAEVNQKMPIKEGMPALPFTFTDTLSGQEKKFPEDFRGKVVMLDFWGTWCGPCQYIVPALKQVYDAHHPQGFDIVGISCERKDAKKERVEEKLRGNGIEWYNAFDENAPAHPATTLYNITSYPTLMIIDQSGNIASKRPFESCTVEGVEGLDRIKACLSQVIERTLKPSYVPTGKTD